MKAKLPLALVIASVFVIALVLPMLPAQKPAQPIPHGQDRMPGPALTPAEAIKKMVVPEGFSVELVASEPDIVNPVAMTFDERGRVWITESLEYPRSSAGAGRDRVKVLEDTDGDGKMDKFTIFAEGLNIPSGIAVGHGGVWVANSPDILFLQDTDGDGKADKREVVVSGFGRTDTHELPNSLTWGPDGWLYGLNGVFNYCDVTHQGKQYKFTCVLFRIHPKTRAFELFAEGTSNPWGVAFDTEGSAFVSACVIDHLWHLTESGYYHRQGGPYPPFTWKLESIVKHKHQKAAYCGLHYFDSDAYPPEYRDRLYMGNIHGGCINVDVLQRDGSTYFAKAAPDFLTANDQWFMPVVQKTGPDGCLYILDWYDRYHCYQDARRDPQGIDRLNGRLYRVRYKDTPRAPRFDLAKESDDKLIERLHSPNVYFRDIAQRLLCERNDKATRARLEKIVLDDQEPRKARMHALWSLVGTGTLNAEFHQKLLAHKDAGYRAWGVRAAGNFKKVEPALKEKVVALAKDSSPDVQVQVAVAARKLEGVEPIPLLVEVLTSCGDDKVIPHIVWQNLHPLLDDHSDALIALLARANLKEATNLSLIMPRVLEKILASRNADPTPLVSLFTMLAEGKNANPAAAQQSLAALANRVQTGEVTGQQLSALRERLQPILGKILADKAENPLHLDAALLAATWKDPEGLAAVRKVIATESQPDAIRIKALDALIAANDPSVLDTAARTLGDTKASSPQLRGQMLSALGRLDNPRVAEIVLANYPRLESELQPRAIELLTQRTGWSKELLKAIGEKKVSANALNVNQVRRLLASKDEEIVKQVKAQWGTLREERNPQREKIIADMRTFIRKNPGDPIVGQKVYMNVCGQCHKMHGEGQEVGPDITVNGRASFDQLLSNVFDPSLVIGASYQATTVETNKGRVLTGLLVEDNKQRVVLKTQGGKLETVPRDDIATLMISKLSMMPEDLEKTLKPKELADLFAYLVLDKPPSDPTARLLPGVREPEPRQTSDPAKFNEILAEVAPGFTVSAVGEGGLALVKEHQGRPWVLRTHPPARGKPCVFRSNVEVPTGRRTRLVLAVSHDPKGDWQLIVRANGEKLHDSIVGPKTTSKGWSELSIDLSKFAGKRVELEIHNHPNDWSNESGYWGRVEVVRD